ncbi:MAG: type II toxin-antitoxin system death-on-curing family toxin [Akkermansiaceae bacterium]|nr:type II toxin-antitoxin system death-on-curing family toxin [Akkermansiaceae bacterium]NJR42684.1 type II toxin-antitoxin system death-on-curing family toxin [Akkermansiaceae bacterium]
MNTTPDISYHLTIDVVLKIHAEATARFGGLDFVREMSLLESTMEALHSTFTDQLPSMDVIEMGAAYLFYMSKNHLFVDGNKRTALGSCITFLRLNGIQTAPDSPEWERLVKAVAASKMNRSEATRALRGLISSDSSSAIPMEFAEAV